MIKFDVDKAMRDFQKHLAFYIKHIQQELLEEARSGMNTPEGREDLEEDDIEMIAGLITTAIIGGPHAVLDEWGTGSMMDTDNPALQDYMNSKFWNPARNDTSIRGRPAGVYTNIFGETETSSGKLEGVNLESLAKKGKLPDNYLPRPASHALKTAQRWMLNGRFQFLLKKAIDSFPWWRYLIVTSTKG